MWLEGLFQDLRFALRALKRDRWFTLTAVTMLALAIGLNVTAFTVMDAMLFRGLPLVQRNDRLVYIQVRKATGPWSVSYLDFEAWRSQAQAFEGVAFAAGGPIIYRDGNGHPIDMGMQRLTANTFGLLRVRPILGRDFTAADEGPGAAPVAILSYRFWESRFGKRADTVGATIHINDTPTTIIGVMPEGFILVYEQNLWMPLTRTSELQQTGVAGSAFGRLRDGAAVEEARAELETINHRLQAADPATDRSVVPLVLNYSQTFIGPDAFMIYGSLWVGACFVLLIACANLTNLALARTVGRRQEISTRIALGAGVMRITRQMLVESLAVGTVAGTLGWWITNWSVRRWAVATAARYVVLDYRVDSGTLAYLVTISLAVAISCSLAPIIKALQLGAGGMPKSDARGITQGPRGRNLVAGLVAGQMTLAIVLLSGAGVLVRSLVNIVDAETGVRNPEKILVGEIRIPPDKYQDNASRLAYFDRLEAELRTIPGIEEESVASSVPVISGNLRTFEIEGRPRVTDDRPSVGFLTVGSGYFRVVGASVLAGRDFDGSDRLAAVPVAIVNQSFAARFWPGEQPLGKRFRAMAQNQPGEWRTVVGIVPNMMHGDALRQNFKPLVYIPFSQEPMARARDSSGSGFSGANFLVRTSLPAEGVAPYVRAKVQKLDADVSVTEFTSLKARFAFNRDAMDLQHAELGKDAALAPVFALVALLLAAIGLYAVLAHSVSQRTKEIGVRMAIGATASDVQRMVLSDGMLPVAAGVIPGLGVSLAVNRILQSQLVGVSPYDPVTMTVAPVVLILVALFACQLPARRATKVDPAVALRHD